MSKVKELAVKAAEEEDVQERLAVKAFPGVILWPLAKSIHSRRIDSLQKALEEARLMQMLDEERRRKAKVGFRPSQRNLVWSGERSDAPLSRRKGVTGLSVGAAERRAPCYATASCGRRSGRRGTEDAQVGQRRGEPRDWS